MEEKKEIIEKNLKCFFIKELNLEIFIQFLPFWGGRINGIPLTNTCSIDYFLLAMWLSHKLSNKIDCIDKEYFGNYEWASKLDAITRRKTRNTFDEMYDVKKIKNQMKALKYLLKK